MCLASLRAYFFPYSIGFPSSYLGAPARPVAPTPPYPPPPYPSALSSKWTRRGAFCQSAVCLPTLHFYRFTPSAGSVPKTVAQKPDSVKIRSKFTAARKRFPRIDQIDEFQGVRADHWRGGLDANSHPLVPTPPHRLLTRP
jgi:hypothetical protein